MTTHHPLPGKPDQKAKLTIRVYRVRSDGSRVEVSSCFSDEEEIPPLVPALTWPACACPRCAVTEVA
ncbi:hypothetical protein HUT16_23500 [Kitasatospora sp. NA04385]|uniref:hypothetical protein n=1 Tax=Kitasatospora sp. NA04385 TaxID=2742135 RepID=UPI00159293BA|nr:hypothetical protein [Kitasatospora sp. NA04385]QKW21629.1 hypothetical protein HUT16_23500 [Kitasatospora sp. NA04385]